LHQDAKLKSQLHHHVNVFTTLHQHLIDEKSHEPSCHVTSFGLNYSVDFHVETVSFQVGKFAFLGYYHPIIKPTLKQILPCIGPVHPAYNPSFSACFFSSNKYFSLTTNQPTVFFSRLISPAERDH
jgi:hypothetical protein